ncbi:hypothetical protein PAXRUDRAFT_157374, partial [Paxillus rubicundulus Ve08.2h10]
STITSCGIFHTRNRLILADSPLASVHHVTMMILSTSTAYLISSLTIFNSSTAIFSFADTSTVFRMYGW